MILTWKQQNQFLDFYSKKPNFYEIDGDEKIDEISSKIESKFYQCLRH